MHIRPGREFSDACAFAMLGRTSSVQFHDPFGFDDDTVMAFRRLMPRRPGLGAPGRYAADRLGGGRLPDISGAGRLDRRQPHGGAYIAWLSDGHSGRVRHIAVDPWRTAAGRVATALFRRSTNAGAGRGRGGSSVRTRIEGRSADSTCRAARAQRHPPGRIRSARRLRARSGAAPSATPSTPSRVSERRS